MIGKPNLVLSQVIRRLSEMKQGPQECKNEKFIHLKQQHANGPVLLPFKGFFQFKSMQLDGMLCSTEDSDSCVRIGSCFGLIRNICRDPKGSADSEALAMFEIFTVVASFI